jgi:hypothetical protein
VVVEWRTVVVVDSSSSSSSELSSGTVVVGEVVEDVFVTEKDPLVAD